MKKNLSRREEKNVGAPVGTLSLFLSCSVSLILISLFILMDADKFNNPRTNIADPDTSTEHPDELEVEELNGEEINHPKKKLSCYKVENRKSKLKEITLSEEGINQLKDALRSGGVQLPSDFVKFIMKREECGYVSTKVEIVLTLGQDASLVEYEKIVNTYMEFNKELLKISRSVELEVIIDNV